MAILSIEHVVKKYGAFTALNFLVSKYWVYYDS